MAGTKDDPRELTPPPGTSAYTMYRDDADPPLLEALGLSELSHDARNNRMRAL